MGQDTVDTNPNTTLIVVEGKPTSSLAIGLSSVGTAVGLIYGITKAENKRWWAVLLYMFAGSTLGAGAGYVLGSKK